VLPEAETSIEVEHGGLEVSEYMGKAVIFGWDRKLIEWLTYQ